MSRGRRFVESGATGEFDLDGARREAADRVVVLKVLDTLDYVRRHPRVGGVTGWTVVPFVVTKGASASQCLSASTDLNRGESTLVIAGQRPPAV